jgi:hypothetical protein
MKQRMEMINEQKKLKELLDKQEEMLKEKQDQIILQQKLHRERLEQLNQIRNVELEQQQQQQQFMYSSAASSSSSIFSNQSQSVNSYPIIETTSSNSNNLLINNPYLMVSNNQLIENITQKVYEQLLIKKQNEIVYSSDRSNNVSLNESRRDQDEKNIEYLKKTVKNNKKINQPVQTNSIFIKQTKQKPNRNEEEMNQQDLEESKLIEDLFFLK